MRSRIFPRTTGSLLIRTTRGPYAQLCQSTVVASNLFAKHTSTRSSTSLPRSILKLRIHILFMTIVAWSATVPSIPYLCRRRTRLSSCPFAPCLPTSTCGLKQQSLGHSDLGHGMHVLLRSSRRCSGRRGRGKTLTIHITMSCGASPRFLTLHHVRGVHTRR